MGLHSGLGDNAAGLSISENQKRVFITYLPTIEMPVIRITVPLSSEARSPDIDPQFPLFRNQMLSALVLPPGGHMGFIRLLFGSRGISPALSIENHPLAQK